MKALLSIVDKLIAISFAMLDKEALLSHAYHDAGITMVALGRMVQLSSDPDRNQYL